MTQQFIRAYRLTVGTVQIDASAGVGLGSMRIAFQIERDANRTPNNVEVAIWNLSKGNRDALAKSANVPVQVEAGYVGDVNTLFLGDLRHARTKREGPDLITRVSAGDGETAIKTASISKTFKAGTPIGDVLGALGKALGLGEGNVRSFRDVKLSSGSSTLARPLTVKGPVFHELEQACRSCGLSWSIQDKSLQLRRIDEPVDATTKGPLLRVDSGLIGTPEVEVASTATKGIAKGKTVVSGTCLLRADLIPGLPFRVESEAFTGNLVCRACVVRADSASTDWYVDFTGTPY